MNTQSLDQLERELIEAHGPLSSLLKAFHLIAKLPLDRDTIEEVNTYKVSLLRIETLFISAQNHIESTRASLIDLLSTGFPEAPQMDFSEDARIQILEAIKSLCELIPGLEHSVNAVHGILNVGPEVDRLPDELAR